MSRIRMQRLAQGLSLVALVLALMVTAPTQSFGQTAAATRYLTEEAPLSGLNFSPYVNGQGPGFGGALTEEGITSRLASVAAYTKAIRTFGATQGLEKIPGIAVKMGLTVAAGAWLSANTTSNELEIANLVAIGRSGQAQTLIVGSEVLLRGDLSEDQLIAYINRVRREVPGAQIAYADTYDVLLNRPRVIQAIDKVFANFYPYWQGVAATDAIPALHCMFGQIKAAAGDRTVVVSEAGWPSSGNSIGGAAPSAANASSFFASFLDWARTRDIPYFYFSAFDEAWKATTANPQEGHWGIWTATGQLKSGFASAMNGVTEHSVLLDGPGTPSVQLLSVPPRGSSAVLTGRVSHASPCQGKVTVYIKVNGGWWIKPTFSAPLTDLKLNGTWSASIVTGGLDAQATEIAAYLLPLGYSPPLLSGATTLPVELQNNALAKTTVSRP